MPTFLAYIVCRDVSDWLGVELPRSWSLRLALRADMLYYYNPRFRRGVRRRGWGGVRYLQAYMRHWLASMIYRWRYDLFRRLPAEFLQGADLPPRVPPNAGRGS
jgi:hypothetical protein